jgi:hypothetical protein
VQFTDFRINLLEAIEKKVKKFIKKYTEKGKYKMISMQNEQVTLSIKRKYLLKGVLTLVVITPFLLIYNKQKETIEESNLKIQQIQERADNYAKAYRDQREQYIQRVKYDREELIKALQKRDEYHNNKLKEAIKTQVTIKK